MKRALSVSNMNFYNNNIIAGASRKSDRNKAFNEMQTKCSPAVPVVLQKNTQLTMSANNITNLERWRQS